MKTGCERCGATRPLQKVVLKAETRQQTSYLCQECIDAVIRANTAWQKTKKS